MPDTNPPLEITPAEVKRKLMDGSKLFLIDVREPAEFQLSSIPGADLIPMRTIPASLQQLDGMADEGDVIVFCHHGMRSLQVVHWLREQGMANCSSMSGGIDRWSTFGIAGWEE